MNIANILPSKKWIIALTGASGMIYAFGLLKYLQILNISVILIISEHARQVITLEYSEILDGHHIGELDTILRAKYSNITIMNNQNIAAPCASGSYRIEGMLIIPASMSAISRIAHGISNDLISRSADVCLKESCPLLVIPRETPLSIIHLENMLTLARAGAKIIPAMPAFYTPIHSIDDLVTQFIGKVLDSMKIEHDFSQRWGQKG